MKAIRVRRMTFVHLCHDHEWQAAKEARIGELVKKGFKRKEIGQIKELEVPVLCGRTELFDKVSQFEPACQTCWAIAVEQDLELTDMPKTRAARQSAAAKKTLEMFRPGEGKS